jgi:hypothetical protein
MAALLKVVDERWGSDQTRIAGPELRLASERVSPREIIAQRVATEVEALNARQGAHDRNRSFLVSVEPAAAEALLNLPGRPKPRPNFDNDHETKRAVEAFLARRFIMLVDNRQIDDLDDEVTLIPGSEVVFLYLNPLRGG